MRLLLVEDDARIARFVAKGLREQAYAVDVASTGEEALYQAAINTYDIVILDVMIPGRNGFEVCRELRKSGQRIPILMLTARDAVEDRIKGLDHGCARYFGAPSNCVPRRLWLAISFWIPLPSPPPVAGVPFHSRPRNTRCSNSSLATAAGFLAGLKSQSMSGTKRLTHFPTSSRFT
jgi:CheY-like chemotaxis protein